jgi:hypothetical protein
MINAEIHAKLDQAKLTAVNLDVAGRDHRHRLELSQASIQVPKRKGLRGLIAALLIGSAIATQFGVAWPWDPGPDHHKSPGLVTAEHGDIGGIGTGPTPT